MAERTTQDAIMTRWSALKTERSSFITEWQDLSDYIMPRAGRFQTTDRNRGGQTKHRKIIDSTATRALRILAAGMMSGMTSPARPWFRLTTGDHALDQFSTVKLWLADVTDLMLRAFAESNTYLTLHGMYEDLGVFGTTCSLVMDDYENVLHHYASPVGEFALGSNYRGKVDTIYREFERTVGDLVKEFGYNNCSQAVRNLYDRSGYDKWVPIYHAVQPREERDATRRDGKNKLFSSCYFEQGAEKGMFLREGGFDDFPGLAPRWNKSGGDIYGNSPGMECLGDIKQLQHQQLRKANGIDFMTKPPIGLPTAMKGMEDSIYVPGGVLFHDNAAAASARNLFDVNINLQHLLMDIGDVRQRIQGSFYADLFLMVSNASDTSMTATEVAERHEEKLLMLGPVLERLHNELLDPMVELTFRKMLRAGVLPPPPEELQGMELNVEFVSMLAQAQRAIGTNSIDRFTGSLGVVAQFKPDVLDKFDSDKWAEIYSDKLGVDPRIIVADEQVAIIRDQRAQAQAQAAQQQAAITQADTLAKLGKVPTANGSNAAMDVINQFSGYGSPSAVEV